MKQSILAELGKELSPFHLRYFFGDKVSNELFFTYQLKSMTRRS